MSLEQRILNIDLENAYYCGKELRAIALEVRKREDRIKQLEDHIKRLEEAGDALYENSYPTRWDLPEANARKMKEQEAWLKAKEDKP